MGTIGHKVTMFVKASESGFKIKSIRWKTKQQPIILLLVSFDILLGRNYTILALVLTYMEMNFISFNCKYYRYEGFAPLVYLKGLGIDV